jgi:hypothetical protein
MAPGVNPTQQKWEIAEYLKTIEILSLKDV